MITALCLTTVLPRFSFFPCVLVLEFGVPRDKGSFSGFVTRDLVWLGIIIDITTATELILNTGLRVRRLIKVDLVFEFNMIYPETRGREMLIRNAPVKAHSSRSSMERRGVGRSSATVDLFAVFRP